jgi:ATP-binding cassette subfamily C protein CydD
VITIAHRLNTVKNAKQLIVMENGCIVQHGDFKALSQQPGEFAKLLKTAQQGVTNG